MFILQLPSGLRIFILRDWIKFGDIVILVDAVGSSTLNQFIGECGQILPSAYLSKTKYLLAAESFWLHERLGIYTKAEFHCNGNALVQLHNFLWQQQCGICTLCYWPSQENNRMANMFSNCHRLKWSGFGRVNRDHFQLIARLENLESLELSCASIDMGDLTEFVEATLGECSFHINYLGVVEAREVTVKINYDASHHELWTTQEPDQSLERLLIVLPGLEKVSVSGKVVHESRSLALRGLTEEQRQALVAKVHAMVAPHANTLKALSVPLFDLAALCNYPALASLTATTFHPKPVLDLGLLRHIHAYNWSYIEQKLSVVEFISGDHCKLLRHLVSLSQQFPVTSLFMSTYMGEDIINTILAEHNLVSLEVEVLTADILYGTAVNTGNIIAHTGLQHFKVVTNCREWCIGRLWQRLLESPCAVTLRTFHWELNLMDATFQPITAKYFNVYATAGAVPACLTSCHVLTPWVHRSDYVASVEGFIQYLTSIPTLTEVTFSGLLNISALHAGTPPLSTLTLCSNSFYPLITLIPAHWWKRFSAVVWPLEDAASYVLAEMLAKHTEPFAFHVSDPACPIGLLTSMALTITEFIERNIEDLSLTMVAALFTNWPQLRVIRSTMFEVDRANQKLLFTPFITGSLSVALLDLVVQQITPVHHLEIQQHEGNIESLDALRTLISWPTLSSFIIRLRVWPAVADYLNAKLPHTLRSFTWVIPNDTWAMRNPRDVALTKEALKRFIHSRPALREVTIITTIYGKRDFEECARPRLKIRVTDQVML